MSEIEAKECGSANLVRGVALLQEKWTLLIVSRLMQGSCGFNELNRKSEGVNATTLSQRLSLLEQAGVLVKTIHSTMPPRTSYELTEAGLALRPVLEEIEAWSRKYLPADRAAGDILPCPGTDEN